MMWRSTFRRGLGLAAAIGAKPLFRRAARKASQAGIDRLHLIVSMDCDTERDIEVAREVHHRLRLLGVQPVYAVAGELVEGGAEIWRELAADGSRFLNHGGRAHAYWDERTGTVTSTYFYDQVPFDEVAEDVRAGHDALQRVLGITATGFRTPHFGTFQGRRDLENLHGLLRSLGYAFSTSTLPGWAYRFGPVFGQLGLPEIPVTGLASRPLLPLDTWTCFFAPDRVRGPDDYVAEASAVAALLSMAGPGVLNVYGDPLHVAGDDRFEAAITALLAVAEPSSYESLLASTR